jgi:hypothetical protein
MIGTIRKHSSWLWWLIAGLTIVSFVVFMGSGPARNGGGGGSTGDYGRIYGRTITAQDFQRARAEYYIYYWTRSSGQWPDKTSSLSPEDMQRDIYIRLLLSEKAKQLGIQVNEDALVTAAGEFLRNISRGSKPIVMEKFLAQVLAPEGLSVLDLQNFLRNELSVQQLIQVLGLPGALVTPQEGSLLYDQDHRQVSAQAVFFSASNYLSQVSVTPAAIAQFYTNSMAVYREPDRVQVSYVWFNVTNYLAAAQTELAKTNFEDVVESAYQQYGATEFADAKTPAEAKTRIRAVLYRQRALADARQAANDFANAVFAITPVKPENLATYAQQNGLVARTTAPFSARLGPAEFNASAAFVRDAFQLTPDEPFANPVVEDDGVYVMALANQLPSAIPSLEEISYRVSQDFEESAAAELARTAGSNFFYSASVQLATGKTFTAAAVASHATPELLPPFSISTSELPELGDRASLNQLKQAAFTTKPGQISRFTPTRDGGFVLFVQQLLPLDETQKKTELADFLAQVRRARENEAFNLWLQVEANRELRDTPFYQKMASGTAR